MVRFSSSRGPYKLDSANLFLYNWPVPLSRIFQGNPKCKGVKMPRGAPAAGYIKSFFNYSKIVGERAGARPPERGNNNHNYYY